MVIPVITGTLQQGYQVIDAIHGIGAAKSGWTSGPNLNEAFEACKEAMRSAASTIGGDAIISCDFEIRNFDKGIEVIGFGTAVKIIQTVWCDDGSPRSR